MLLSCAGAVLVSPCAQTPSRLLPASFPLESVNNQQLYCSSTAVTVDVLYDSQHVISINTAASQLN